MHELIKEHSPKKHAESFGHAFRGMRHTFLNEANFRVQIGISIILVFLGLFYEIKTIEWGFVAIGIGIMLCAELMNTVVENLIDTVIKDYHEGAKIVKDISAAFVLFSAFTTLILILLVFGKYFINILI